MGSKYPLTVEGISFAMIRQKIMINLDTHVIHYSYSFVLVCLETGIDSVCSLVSVI